MLTKRPSGIFLFNIIPSYRPGMRKVFDHGFYDLACTPSLAQRIKQNTLYTSFENAVGENLSDLDLLYVMATDGTRVYAKINWVNPGTFQGIESGTPTFTENGGFTGGSPAYITTQWAPDPDAISFAQDDGSFFCYNNVSRAGNSSNTILGCRGNGGGALNGQTLLLAKDGSNQHQFGVNGPASGGGSGVDSAGFYHSKRTSSTSISLFKNGALVTTTSPISSTTLSTADMVLLAVNYNGSIGTHSIDQIGIFGIGASLTGQESALYTAWNNYFTSL